MAMIKFRLPAGVRRFDPSGCLDELREKFTKFYMEGFTEDYGMAAWMRPPVVGESVSLKGTEFTVHAVVHYYEPEDGDDEPFAPFTYVVLR